MKTASFFTYSGPGRISIARFAPRGTPKGFRVFKPLAPGPWFNSVSREKYVELYQAEMLDHLDPQETWNALHELAGGAEPVLLCWEKPPFTSDNWCHRRIASDWLAKAMAVDIPELAPAPR